MDPFETTVDNQHRLEKPKIAEFSIIQLSFGGLAMLITASGTLSAQESPQAAKEDKRILWIFTHHRTTEDEADLPKLTPKGKFAIAWGDATDRAIFAQTAFISGIGQTIKANPSFGQGVMTVNICSLRAYARLRNSRLR